MRGPQSLFYTNPGPGGRQVVGEDDPRQAVKVYQAGEHISEQRAKELGIYDWLVDGEPSAGPQRQMVAAEDAEAQSKKAVESSRNVRAWGYERRPFMTPSIEERAYVENAVGQPIQLSEAERGEAGRMGGVMTGPTIPEVAQAGSYAEATDKANADMTAGQEQTPPAARGQRTSPPPPPRGDDPGAKP